MHGFKLNFLTLHIDKKSEWPVYGSIEGLWSDCQASVPLKFLEGGQWMVTYNFNWPIITNNTLTTDKAKWVRLCYI